MNTQANVTNASLLVEYTKEIMPLVRNVEYVKDQIKDFKESNEEINNILEEKKTLTDKINAIVEADDFGKELLEKLKVAENELKQAVKGAAKSVEGVKPAELKAYYKARAKDEGVKKVVVKGEKFDVLDKALV